MCLTLINSINPIWLRLIIWYVDVILFFIRYSPTYIILKFKMTLKVSKIDIISDFWKINELLVLIGNKIDICIKNYLKNNVQAPWYKTT